MLAYGEFFFFFGPFRDIFLGSSLSSLFQNSQLFIQIIRHGSAGAQKCDWLVFGGRPCSASGPIFVIGVLILGWIVLSPLSAALIG